MKKIITYFLLILTATGCIMKTKKGPIPEQFFSGQDLAMAIAIYNGDKKNIKQCLQNGTDINKPGEAGVTYLLYAMFVENYSMVESLLEHGADPNQHSFFYPRILSEEEKKNYSIYTHIPLAFSCCSRFDIKYMKLLIKYGAKINDARDATPLGYAVESEDYKKIKYLVEHGADLNFVSDKMTRTEITVMASIFRWDMVEFLWELGADPMISDKKGVNVASCLQKSIDRGFSSKQIDRIKKRLENLGVKFPYINHKSLQNSQIK